MRLWIFKIDTLSKSLQELFKKVILLFIVYSTGHTYSVILIPLLVCCYLYYQNISKKRPTNERILFYLNNKGVTNWDKKTVKETSCSPRAKNLLNSNNIAESEENAISNLPIAGVVHIKPVKLDKDVQPSNLIFQQAW